MAENSIMVEFPAIFIFFLPFFAVTNAS